MSEQIRQIALRIRELRELNNLSPEEMADRTGVSIDLYHEYEQGKHDMPISFLCAVSAEFDVELTSLVTGEEPKLKSYSVVRKGDGVEIDRYEDHHFRSLAYKMSHKIMEPFFVTCPVRKSTDPVHMVSHEGHEFNYVLEGTLKVTVGNHEFILNEGDSLYFDASQSHASRNMGDTPAKYLAVVSGSEVL